MIDDDGTLLAGMSAAARARSTVAAGSSLIWATGRDAGTTVYFEECGSPMLLATDETAAELLGAGAGRIVLDLHPRLGLVRLTGQFWPLAGRDAEPALEALRTRHADCSGCDGVPYSRVIGLQVVTVSIRLPGDPVHRPIDLDDYVLAEPEPMVTVGAGIAAHLNADHEPENRALGANLLGEGLGHVAGARVGAVGAAGFELAVVDQTGGWLLTVPFEHPAEDVHQLQRDFHAAITAATGRARRS